MSATNSELRALADARTRYEAQGYTVQFEERLPAPFDGLIADAVARREGEAVLIELRPTAMTAERRERLNRLAVLVDEQPGWRIDIVSFDPADHAPLPSDDDARRRLQEARAILGTSPDAAVLMTWSAIEGGLWKLSRSQDRAASPRPSAPRRLIRELLVDGLISGAQAARLDDFAQERNLIAHGWDATSRLQPGELDWFMTFAEALLDDSIPTVDRMVEWFDSNFESPDDAGIPFESAEGGYQWLGFGPHDAEDVLTDHFRDALDEDIALAVSEIETRGIAWARRDKQP